MEASSGRRATASSPRLARRGHVHDERRRPRISSCSASPPSCWLVGCLTAIILPTLCLGQDGVERTDDGKERGPNSTLAKKAELWLPVALVGSLALLVIVFCIRKARSMSTVEEEEEGVGDVEEAKDEKGLTGPVERIARTAIVWDDKQAWDQKSSAPPASVTTASASVTSSSSYEDAMSSQSRALSNDRRHVSGALRSASKLPRYSSDRLQSPIHGGPVAAGGRRSGGRRMQRGDAGRGERVQKEGPEGVERQEEGPSGGSDQPDEVPRAHQDASVGDNPQEIYILHH